MDSINYAESDPSGSYSLQLPRTGEYVLFVDMGSQGQDQARFVVHVPEGVNEFHHDLELPPP